MGILRPPITDAEDKGCDAMAELIVVDDEPDLRTMLAEYLAWAGHRVRLAADGAELRGLLAEASADLVVLDVGLPGEDGFRLARWLREWHNPGIVMLTGADTTIDRVVGLEVGADDFLGKPFEACRAAGAESIWCCAVAHQAAGQRLCRKASWRLGHTGFRH